MGKALITNKIKRPKYSVPTISDVGKNYPDVYIILSDAYTSVEMLKKYHNEENQSFVQFLDSARFRIAPNARSSYKYTYRTLASVWNLDYLSDSLDDTPDPSIKYVQLEEMFQDNVASKWFKERGYTCINITSYPFWGQPPSGIFNNGSDAVDNISDFRTEVFNKTIIYSFLGRIIDVWVTMPKEKERHERIINATIKAAQLEISSPKLVFCHIYMPHDPYVFDRNGNLDLFSNPYNMSADKYHEQLLYTNTLLKRLINGLLKVPGDPIIVLTGDHGYRQFNFEPERTEASYGALTAFRFPSNDYSQVRSRLTSPNILRVVMNQIQPSAFPLLKDTSNFYYNSMNKKDLLN
jgi:hypothetical protein